MRTTRPGGPTPRDGDWPLVRLATVLADIARCGCAEHAGVGESQSTAQAEEATGAEGNRAASPGDPLGKTSLERAMAAGPTSVERHADQRARSPK
jgi:hypothetical protein